MPVGTVDNMLWAAEVDKDPEDDGNDDDTGLLDSDGHNAASAYDKLRAKNPRAIRWAPHRMFRDDLAYDLHHDAEVITGMLQRFGVWDHQSDSKITALHQLLTERFPDEKALVFTEAADTAGYVHEELLRRGVAAVGVVTGDAENPTTTRHAPEARRSIARKSYNVYGCRSAEIWIAGSSAIAHVVEVARQI